METLGIITPVQPYDFDLTLNLFARYTHPVLDIVHDGAYWRVLDTGEGLALLRVDNIGDDLRPALRVSLVTASGPVDGAALLAQMRRILCADIDPNPFYDHARQHPELWRVVEPVRGVRWLRTATAFEALLLTIIEQQIAWVAAQRAQRWLCEWGQRRLEYNGRAYYALPTPAQLAAVADVQELAPLKITFRRMGVIVDIARQIASGAFDVEELLALPAEAAYQQLVGLKGVGHWTAAYVIQRTGGDHNYVIYNDVAMQAAANHYFYGGSGRIPQEQVAQTFARYGAFAGAAAYHTIMRWVLDRYEPSDGAASNGMPHT